ncbi:hypothetical protein [Aurantimonas sp. VKM B-3413]|uniref:hypothetical protein n=1 Tax=Aurantimonas sp. VKM B-3413 TaxID=2779401 RepID=UPI001E3AA314|nr:hypothetical protein [Aurantimonas sp. VKM B-3413]MCB8836235.1 hypothetical protein [Aurantimonas sp. VKM B-3413]
MIVRQAFFEGAIHPGREMEFRHFVETRLIPMWRRFPGVRDLRVLFALERDDGAPPFLLSLAMTFDDRAALAEALEAPIRYESRAVTGELMKMFDGHIHHHVFQVIG